MKIIKICSIFLLYIFFYKAHCDSIFLLSIPKCGTHLLAKAIELMTDKKLANEIEEHTVELNGLPKPNITTFGRCHLPYSKIYETQLQKDFKTFFIYRDPRDQVVARAYWTQKLVRGMYHMNSVSNPPMPSISQLIDYIIKDIDKYYSKFMPWKHSTGICTLKFENLIGSFGGGKEHLQKNALKKICKFLNIKFDKINYCIKNLFGKSQTFREGKIGSWKTHFNQNQKNQFKKIAGKLLIDLKYEKNFTW